MSPPIAWRSFLTVSGTLGLSTLAGCNALGAGGNAISVVVENNHDRLHMGTVSVMSHFDGGYGFVDYFSGNWQTDGVERFDDAIRGPDSEPWLTVLAMLDDETVARRDFRLSLDAEAIRIQVSSAGELTIGADPSGMTTPIPE